MRMPKTSEITVGSGYYQRGDAIIKDGQLYKIISVINPILGTYKIKKVSPFVYEIQTFLHSLNII